MKVSRLPALPDLPLFEPPVFRDERGSFRELYPVDRLTAVGSPDSSTIVSPRSGQLKFTC